MGDIFSKHNIADTSAPVLMLAPMEGVTSPPFRKLITEVGGVDLVATEFIRITGPKQKVKPFTYHQVPLQIQLMAVSADVISACLEFLKQRGLLKDEDWLDLNVGCPSKRVNSHGAGAALLLDPKKLVDIINSMRSKHSGPLSIKTRIGYQNSEDFPEILKYLADTKIDFISIHARTKCAGYSDPINLDYLEQAVKTLPFPVIGNGDIWKVEDAWNMLNETGVRGVMCGRGAISNPFIFHDIKNKLNPTSFKPEKKLHRQKRLLDFALDLVEANKVIEKKPGARIGTFKEFAIWFSKNPLIGRSFFQNIKRLNNWDEIKNTLIWNHNENT